MLFIILSKLKSYKLSSTLNLCFILNCIQLLQTELHQSSKQFLMTFFMKPAEEERKLDGVT